ncbi:MAG: hypothetical protein HOE53_00915 [Candidatus Magasanikbacteria bacterium]|jgi:thymidylate kinase|nr:hypothetical protein [Candidatus Magasanikbacteria bacterium]
MAQGKFIVFYGINNLGKSTQAKKLVDRLNEAGETSLYIKYPIYDLAPSGPQLNAYLREGNPHKLSPREAQLLYILNRTQYQADVDKHLAEGTHIIAEDYTGTGIAWGTGSGVDQSYLKETNSHLRKEDIAFHFVGNRFMEAQEQNHKFETDSELMRIVKQTHDELAAEYGWEEIDANKSIDDIHDKLWNRLSTLLSS